MCLIIRSVHCCLCRHPAYSTLYGAIIFQPLLCGSRRKSHQSRRFHSAELDTVNVVPHIMPGLVLPCLYYHHQHCTEYLLPSLSSDNLIILHIYFCYHRIPNMPHLFCCYINHPTYLRPYPLLSLSAFPVISPFCFRYIYQPDSPLYFSTSVVPIVLIHLCNLLHLVSLLLMSLLSHFSNVEEFFVPHIYHFFLHCPNSMTKSPLSHTSSTTIITCSHQHASLTPTPFSRISSVTAIILRHLTTSPYPPKSSPPLMLLPFYSIFAPCVLHHHNCTTYLPLTPSLLCASTTESIVPCLFSIFFAPLSVVQILSRNPWLATMALAIAATRAVEYNF